MFIRDFVVWLKVLWRRPQISVATIALAAVLMVPRTAHAQSGQLVLEGITDHSAREAIRAQIDDASRRGVPAGPLYSKVREGIAKQSTPGDIRSAVEKLAGRLEIAQRALAPVYGVDEVIAGAGALVVSVPERTLRDMRKAWPDRTLTVPLGVLTELVANGIPARNAAERVYSLLERGASSAQIVELGEAVRADVAAGTPADASIEVRFRGITSLLNSPGAATTGTATDLGATRGVGRRPPRPPGQ